MRLSFYPIGNVYWVTACVVALLALMWLGPIRAPLSLGRRRTLVGLRLATIALVALAMLRPTLVRTTVQSQPSTLVLLLDASRSMQVADAAGKLTRWQALVEAVRAAQPELSNLGENVELRAYAVTDQTTTLPVSAGGIELPPEPLGDQSALGAALEDVVRREAGKRIAGIVLVSDGAQRALAPRDVAPQIAARRLADQGYRLDVVPLGQDRGLGQLRDVAVAELRVPPTVFVKNQLDVQVTTRAEGFSGQTLPLQFLFETTPGKLEPVAAQSVQPSFDGEQRPVVFTHIPEQAGEFKLTVRIPPQPGETVTTNNEVSTFVSVQPGGLNVLYLEGLARVEQKFLRRALDASPDIRVDYERLDPQRPNLRPTDFAARLEPGKYDVYLLGDLDARAFAARELEQLGTTVEQGAGLMMLGGLHSFGAGGYGSTPLANVLPINIERLERQNFNEPVRGDLHVAGERRLRPTRIGQSQSLLQLGSSEENVNLWGRLPPLEGANRFRGLKPGAVVLADDEQGTPLLVAKDFGRGRVLAFAGDTTWRWPLAGFANEHRRFWRQTILWLARKDQGGEGPVWITLEERRIAPGGIAEFQVGARGPGGEALTDVSFQVEVVRPDGSSGTARLQRQGEEQRGLVLDTVQPGDYQLRVRALVAGSPLGSAQARFLVYNQDLELENSAADRGTLESLALMTQGNVAAPEELGPLIRDIQSRARQWEVETEIKRSLWDTWPFFLLFTLLTSFEWYCRKRWGLV